MDEVPKGPPERRAKVTALAEGLRRLADTLEANQALYDPLAFERDATALARGFRAFLRREPELHRVPEGAFRACRAAWLRAWQENPGELERRCEAVLGRLPHHVADESEVSWRLHLLVEVLLRLRDPDRVLELTGAASSSAAEGGGGHVEDVAATEAMLAWGQLTLEEFLLGWTKLDPDLVRRCAALVGVAMTRPSLAVKRKLHGLAVRLYRNTMM
jgi:hypothetical protein